jgi:hypothetical protein
MGGSGNMAKTVTKEDQLCGMQAVLSKMALEYKKSRNAKCDKALDTELKVRIGTIGRMIAGDYDGKLSEICGIAEKMNKELILESN